MHKDKKNEVVGELTTCLTESQATIVTDFHGLKVDELGLLRTKIREAGGSYRVSKNTLVRLAAKGTPSEGIISFLVGNNALGTTTGDPVPLAKVLVEFAKDHDKFVVKGGVLTGKSVTADQIKALAELPSREILLSMMLGAMNAVPGGFVRVLAAVPQNFLYALSAIRDQKESQAA